MSPTAAAKRISVERLGAQRLHGPGCPSVADVVRWSGAVQSQDYAGAKWSLALRCGRPTRAEIDAAFDRGDLIRTHILRPTWHFVAPEDLRWMQRLTAARVHAVNGHMKRKLGLEDALVKRSRGMLERVLGETEAVTRDEIASAFSRAKLPSKGVALAYLVMNAELEGVICSGPRRGKKFTYTLVDARIPAHTTLDGDEALCELTWRYFRSHGPASARDFSWWSGLSLTVAKRGIAATESRLVSRTVGGELYWTAADFHPLSLRSPQVQILSFYDELLVAYRDHTHSCAPAVREALSNAPEFLTTAVVLNGQVIGQCRKEERRDVLRLDGRVCRDLSPRESCALQQAADAYGLHCRMPVQLSVRRM